MPATSDILSDAQEQQSKALAYVAQAEKAVRKGKAFSYSVRSTDVATTGTLILSLTTPASGYIHLQGYEVFASGGLGIIDIMEAPTLSSGTVVTPGNHRRVGTPATSGVTLKVGPTVTGEGTSLLLRMFGTEAGGHLPRVLKPATTYIFRLGNHAASAANLAITIEWTEEDAG